MKTKLISLIQQITVHKLRASIVLLSVLLVCLGVGGGVFAFSKSTQLQSDLRQQLEKVMRENEELTQQIAELQTQLVELLARDEYQKNIENEAELKNLNETYTLASKIYERMIDQRENLENLDELEVQYAQIVAYLSERNYASASSELASLEKTIDTQLTKPVEIATQPSTANVTVSNDAPSSGYQVQRVSTPLGEFVVELIAADLGSTKVIVDTASSGDCGNECPVLPLSDYVSRNGAFAGINGSYFCPASYPSCAGKTNSFDTLLMNKDKTYFNSDNNVYSTNPAVIFGSGWIRFVERSLEWGRDTSIDSMIANYPLLVSGGQSRFSGDSDPKKSSRSHRSFVANKGNTVYIGVVRSASVAESAAALSAMGMDNALNLDSGGSTALWYGGYKAGPGRNIPNAILFVRK